MQTENAAENGTEEFGETAVSPGEMLREERLRQSLTEKEVADELHITMHYVRAIEANAYEKLPGAIFAKGYIKSYAELLKLDENLVLDLFAEFTNQQIEKEKQKTLIQVRKRRDKNRPWVVLSIVGFVGGFTGLWAYNKFVSVDQSDIDVSAATSQNARLSPMPTTEITSNARDDDQELPQENSAQANNAALQELAVEQQSTTQPDNSSGFDSSTNGSKFVAADPAVTTISSTESNFADVLASLASESWATESLEGNALAPESFSADVAAEVSDQIITISANGSDILRISFSGESWVEIIDEEQNPIYRDIRSAGDIVEVTGNAPFNILLGDAPFTRLTFNGDEIDVSDNIRIDNSARLTVGL